MWREVRILHNQQRFVWERACQPAEIRSVFDGCIRLRNMSFCLLTIYGRDPRFEINLVLRLKNVVQAGAGCGAAYICAGPQMTLVNRTRALPFPKKSTCVYTFTHLGVVFQ